MAVHAARALSLLEPAAPVEAGLGPLRILVALDGTGASQGALREAIRLATAGHARLTIATVVESAPWWACAGVFAAPLQLEDLRRACVRQAEAALAAARRSVPADLSVTTRMLHGRSSHALAHEALAGGYDLVVTETETPHRPGAWWRGRRACALVRRSPISVLVVRRV